VALGVSAYSAGIFHLMTHAFFKALLFLAAGSVIIGMHHEQDMRKMGGLAKYMPITAVTSWIGALALIGTPFFAGFYSKDAIIEAVGESHRWGAQYAYWCVLLGVFVTALYTFRMIFMTFHGPERFRHSHAVHVHGDATTGHEEEQEQPSAKGAHPGQSQGQAGRAHAAAAGHSPNTAAHGVAAVAHGPADTHGSAAHAAGHATSVAQADHNDAHGEHHGPPHESPAVVTVPLIALAIPSVLIGFFTIGPVLFGDYFGSAIQVLEHNNVVGEIGREYQGPVQFALHGFAAPPFWFAAAGVFCAWLFFLKKPSLSYKVASAFSWLREILVQKYYFDWFNQTIIASLTRLIGVGLWKGGDQVLIDGALVNGSAHTVNWFGSIIRRVQNGYLYSYAFWMVIGLAILLGWFLERG
jgi:NADH-quinone oxidoreductase subunit L